MELKIDKVICSETQKDTGYFQIASGYISETVILFEKDRWITKRVGAHTLNFQIAEKTITVA